MIEPNGDIFHQNFSKAQNRYMIGVNLETRNFAIDFLKGISILYIAGYWHLFNYTKAFPNYQNVVTDRLLMVTLGLFVLISGYLIGTKANNDSKNGLVVFYSKRLLRIYPPFIFFSIIFYILNIGSGKKLFKTATLISMVFPPAANTLWFVAMIITFYLITPLLINMSKNMVKYFLFCVLLFGSAFIFNHFFNILNERLILFFPTFAVGVLLAVYKELIYNLRLSVVTLFLTASIMVTFIDNVTEFLWIPLILFGPLLCFLVALRKERKIERFNIMGHIGYASLFVYLSHRPIYEVLQNLYFPQSGIWQLFYLAAISLPLIIAISWGLQKWYNKIILFFTSKSVTIGRAAGLGM
jgi:peptidoglycan/LPS O-acetylase OafA/YrhL